MNEIESESKFLWKLILHILLTPITLMQVIFRKKEFAELFRPFVDIFQFLFEPVFTISIIIINILAFGANVLMKGGLTSAFACYPKDMLTAKFYTLVTAGFLHADLTHLLFNMLGIFIFGRVVERKIGFFKTGLVYFGSLVISSISYSLVTWLVMGNNTPMIGASGALMGLVSAAILLSPFYITFELLIPMPIMVAGWLTIYADLAGIISRVQDGVAHFAHLGGFLSVSIIMFILGGDERRSMLKGLVINIVSLVAVGILYLVVLR